MLKEVEEKVERVFDMFEGSFIHNNEELILNKKWNVYFRLQDIETQSDFDYKILSYLSYYTASHHFSFRSAQCKWALHKLIRWFRKDFSIDEMQIIYQKIGTGANKPLGIKFIESGFDINILSGNTQSK
jgi:hypothetical protein